VGETWFPPRERAEGEGRSRVRPLEEPLPALEQGLELVARVAVSRQHLDIVPVFRDGSVLTSIGAGEADRLLGDGTFAGGIVPKLRAAVIAARNGVRTEIGETAVVA
jgi:hypothetical protein